MKLKVVSEEFCVTKSYVKDDVSQNCVLKVLCHKVGPTCHLQRGCHQVLRLPRSGAQACHHVTKYNPCHAKQKGMLPSATHGTQKEGKYYIA